VRNSEIDAQRGEAAQRERNATGARNEQRESIRALLVRHIGAPSADHGGAGDRDRGTRKHETVFVEPRDL
jgi:hypothetical protein